MSAHDESESVRGQTILAPRSVIEEPLFRCVPAVGGVYSRGRLALRFPFRSVLLPFWLADLETTPLIDANPLENNETGRP